MDDLKATGFRTRRSLPGAQRVTVGLAAAMVLVSACAVDEDSSESIPDSVGATTTSFLPEVSGVVESSTAEVTVEGGHSALEWDLDGLGDLAWGVSLEEAQDALDPLLGEPDHSGSCNPAAIETLIWSGVRLEFTSQDGLYLYELEGSGHSSGLGFGPGTLLEDAQRRVPEITTEEAENGAALWRIGVWANPPETAGAYGSLRSDADDSALVVGDFVRAWAPDIFQPLCVVS